ncbi:hypothetical protein M9H77_07961 [Catharanthus roseus]|uniref:Uncharacterized protein n=1 Tax=Catharanthus roseus TaxID=4058 RepID=A0ACC0BWG3_CATRO|nr:hypothetical protein M9H77_07961 [Catharanthus roseus]
MKYIEHLREETRVPSVSFSLYTRYQCYRRKNYEENMRNTMKTIIIVLILMKDITLVLTKMIVMNGGGIQRDMHEFLEDSSPRVKARRMVLGRLVGFHYKYPIMPQV